MERFELAVRVQSSDSPLIKLLESKPYLFLIIFFDFIVPAVVQLLSARLMPLGSDYFSINIIVIISAMIGACLAVGPFVRSRREKQLIDCKNESA